MELIILLITIFFVWRHFRKKKANREAARAEYQARKQVESDPTLGPLVPPQKRSLRGAPVTESNFPKKMKDVYEGADHFGKIKVDDPEDPDMAFACTKRAFEANSKDIANLTIELNEDAKCCRCLRWGVRLAIFYRDGYGCEPDAQAAIDILLKIDPIWVRMFAYTEQMAHSHRLSEDAARYANQMIDLKVEAWEYLADCNAIVGQGAVADEFYRQSYEQADACRNPDYWRNQIIRHAMGDYAAMYGDYSLSRPRPVRYAAAAELALSMAGQDKPMGGHFLMALAELRKLDINALGHSWEEDFRIYSSADGAYPLYRTGLALLYGLGTEQNVKEALSCLVQAYEQGSIMAAEQLSEYYYRLQSLSQLAKGLYSDWSRKYERMKVNPEALLKVMSTGVVNEATAEYGEKYSTSKTDRADKQTGSTASAENSGKTAGADEFDISRIPAIVYDDSNRQWKRRGIYGDHAVYYNNDGDEVTIYSAQVSGNSASTSAGTLHWY